VVHFEVGGTLCQARPGCENAPRLPAEHPCIHKGGIAGSRALLRRKPPCLRAVDRRRTAQHMHAVQGNENRHSNSAFELCHGIVACAKHGFIHRCVDPISGFKVVECFGGTCRIASSCALQGVLSESYEITRSPFEDCMSLSHTRYIKNGVVSGGIGVLWLGVMCGSWTLARRGNPDYSGWPPPLRDNDKHIGGLPNLRASDQARVELGNRSVKWCCYLIRLAIKHGVAVVLENPARSRLFLAPSLAPLLPLCSSNVVFDHCQFYAPHRKSTRLVSWNIDLSSMAKQCHARKGLCSRTGRPHSCLSGLDSTGQFKTAGGSAYPVEFCKRIACLFVDHVKLGRNK
jgi:hypothetical protein